MFFPVSSTYIRVRVICCYTSMKSTHLNLNTWASCTSVYTLTYLQPTDHSHILNAHRNLPLHGKFIAFTTLTINQQLLPRTISWAWLYPAMVQSLNLVHNFSSFFFNYYWFPPDKILISPIPSLGCGKVIHYFFSWSLSPFFILFFPFSTGTWWQMIISTMFWIASQLFSPVAYCLNCVTNSNSQIRFPIGISNSVEPNEIPFIYVIFLLLLFSLFQWGTPQTTQLFKLKIWKSFLISKSSHFPPYTFKQFLNSSSLFLHCQNHCPRI